LRERMAATFARIGLAPIHRAAKVFVTFHLTLVAWVFFRARSLADAQYILVHSVADLRLRFGGYGLPLDRIELTVAALGILAMESVQLLQAKGSLRPAMAATPIWLRWPAYYAALAVLLLFGYFGPANQFIYFQF